MARATKPRKIGNHTADDMKNALTNIKNGMSVRKASKTSGISFSTLRRYYLKTKNVNVDEARLTPNYSVNKIFTTDQENMLKEYFKHCALLFYGLSAKECRKIAYQMANVNNLKMPNSWKRKEMAGKDWLLNFRKRHTELTLRKPEACSLARATAFNRHNVDRFYDNLEKLIKRDPAFADGTRIYNLDETSTTTVQKPGKVIAPKGRKNIGKVTSGERGTLVTTCCIISASGIALPPVIVFPRKKYKEFMIKNTPPGTLGLATPTGWMNCQIFPEVMKHFIKHSNTTPENPSILIMDNHESHLSLESLDLAKASGVHVLTLHPHTSGKLQPLDVGIYGPFKTYYNAAIDAWMLRNPGKPITIYDIGEIAGSAFLKVMTPTNITKSFKACGIFPFDRNLFDDEDFLPSSVTDRPCPDCAPRQETSITGPPSISPVQVSIDQPGSSTKDSNTHATSISLPDLRRASDSDATLFEEDIDFIPNDTEMQQISSDGTRDKGDSPSIMQEAAEITQHPLLATQTENSIANFQKPSTPPGNIINSVEIHIPSPLTELDCNRDHFTHRELASTIVDKQPIISPFQFRDPIKAAPRKSNRKERKLGRSLIATDTPEKLEIEMTKKLTNKRKEAKKRKVTKKVLQSDSEEDNEDPGEVTYQESDEDDEWPDEEIDNDPIIITENYLKMPLSHIPQEAEYVLVEFSTKKSKVYYVGKVLESRNRKLEYYISFLRRKSDNKFHMPNEPDVSYVKEHDIKFALPKPNLVGSTSRQQSYFSFSVDLSSLNIR